MFLILNLFILLNPTVLFSEGDVAHFEFNNVLNKIKMSLKSKDFYKKIALSFLRYVLFFFKYYLLFIRFVYFYFVFLIPLTCLIINKSINEEVYINIAIFMFVFLIQINYKSDFEEFKKQYKKLKGFNLFFYIAFKIIRIVIYCFIYTLMFYLTFALLILYYTSDFAYYMFFKSNEMNIQKINNSLEDIEKYVEALVIEKKLDKDRYEKIYDNLKKARDLSKIETSEFLQKHNIKNLRNIIVQLIAVFHQDKNSDKYGLDLNMHVNITIALNGHKEYLDVCLSNDYEDIVRIMHYSFIVGNAKLKEIGLCVKDFSEIKKSVIKQLEEEEEVSGVFSEFKKSKLLFFDKFVDDKKNKAKQMQAMQISVI